jgi:hypothetical protein
MTALIRSRSLLAAAIATGLLATNGLAATAQDRAPRAERLPVETIAARSLRSRRRGGQRRRGDGGDDRRHAGPR